MRRRLNKHFLLGISLFLLLFNSCKTNYYQSQDSQKQMIAIDSKLEEDPKINTLVIPYRQQLEAKMSEVIGLSKESMAQNRSLAESQLGNFFADALLVIGKNMDASVDFSLATKDGMRSSIKQGNITVGNIFEFMPFENAITILELKGTDVLLLAKFIAETNGQPIAGASIVIKNKQLVSFLINKETIDPNKSYKLVTYDFVANGGDHVQGLSNPISRITAPSLVRESLIDYIQTLTKSGRQVEAALDGRVKIIQ
ncbi:5'-nucleotidase C-terminal domain-containing protein [Sphingobacterium sp. HJSM2_6]|uniref:5'-nucleotidase C-terminal domain-containing protein n=1 Tax=Sphingobacterium sp. HJSM2_6 TaxID=3366264 RepID=UPI003BCE5057